MRSGKKIIDPSRCKDLEETHLGVEDSHPLARSAASRWLGLGGWLPMIHGGVTLWLFNIAMESDPFVDDFPMKTSIYRGFSMGMLNNQMVEVENFSDTLLGFFRSVQGIFWSDLMI